MSRSLTCAPASAIMRVMSDDTASIYAARWGVLIRKKRQALGYSQQSLADRLGVSLSTVRMWEYGRTTPSHRHIGSLVRELGIADNALTHIYREPAA